MTAFLITREGVGRFFPSIIYTQRTQRERERERDAEADFISAESLGLTLRQHPEGIDIVTYNYVRAIHRGNSGVYSSSVGRVNFREGSPFADPRAKRGWQGR